jgi:peptidoglycan hydrolase CwlO-like protein
LKIYDNHSRRVLTIKEKITIISVGQEEVPIDSKYTLLNGKIKKNLLNKYKNKSFLELSKTLNEISLEKFVEVLKEESEDSQNLIKSNKILDFLNQYRQKISDNITITSQFNEIMQNLVLVFRYNALLKQKKILSREIEISSQFKKSSDIKASTDLLKKLNESVMKNKNKLEFLKEDYLQPKNQIEKINKEIRDLNNKIQNLTNQKKKYFGEINKITRIMSSETPETKNKIDNDSQSNLTNAEKIKNYQKKAKDTQFEINTIKSKINELQQRLDELAPNFNLYEKDYLNLQNIINTEEERIKDLQSKLKERINDDKELSINDFGQIDVNSIRPTQEIKENIKEIDLELKRIKISEDYFNSQKPQDLSQVISKINELDQKVINNHPELTIDINEKEIKDSLEQFRELENKINKIEILTNKFLPEINLKSRFGIVVPEIYDQFLIYIEFNRKETDKISFDGLTTPEKIFFIIIFYISIKLLFNKNDIIFSNVSILSQYNKAGSIYRTIRKLIPIFEQDKNLTNQNLIFILSNLELKKEIKSLKVITIKES